MKTNFVKAFVFGLAFATAAVVGMGSAAIAAGRTHTLSATTPADGAYDIKLVTPIAAGRLTVQVVNKKTGELVTNAHVAMRHWVPGHKKNAPGPEQDMIPLESDGHGGYVCMREHVGHGERIVVRAHVPGDLEGTWSELTIDN